MLTLLNATDADEAFPDPENALTEPDGLLALGGCLSPKRIINAYRKGIFPWFNEGDPILWWSPDPRLVLIPTAIRLSRSLRKTLRKKEYRITFDQAFNDTIHGCAAPRREAHGTWITDPMISAYSELHTLGYAHSVEAWYQDRLVGGLYGVAIGRAFFGESMFYRRTNASKVALAVLAEKLSLWDYALIDCQVQTEHMTALGAKQIPRREFIDRVTRYCNESVAADAWASPDSSLVS